MTRKEKTYRFAAVAYNVDPELVDNRTVRIMKVKALRSDSSEKIAENRIEKLNKQTGVTWTLHSEPHRLSDRQERANRMARFTGRANDAMWATIMSHRDFWGEIEKLTQSEKYMSAKGPDRVLMKIELLHGKVGNTESLREAAEFARLAALETTRKVYRRSTKKCGRHTHGIDARSSEGAA